MKTRVWMAFVRFSDSQATNSPYRPSGIGITPHAFVQYTLWQLSAATDYLLVEVTEYQLDKVTPEGMRNKE